MGRLFAKALCVLGLTLFATVASASSLDVSPITLPLSDATPSAMLTVTNRGAEPMRCQVTVFAWEESPSGEMLLSPTSDVVFFPSMLTLAPQEARAIRIGTNIKQGAVEKTYRVFVQELPPEGANQNPGMVRMLTKVGIPIFLESTNPKPKPGVSALSINGAQLSFTVNNAGSAHFRAEKFVVRARKDSKVLHSQEVAGWYVLAGQKRTYVVNLPKEVCAVLSSVDVELASNKGGASASLPNATCTP